ncbi:MAG TPA: rhodanese-like domain-containing protein [Anaerolineales bacterium]|nr:rhodanese-like domain-containing protein [Anaerolineales bacterium]
MPKTKIIFAISALILITLACNTLLPSASAGPTSTVVAITEPTFPVQQPDLPATEAEVPRVSLEQALTAYTAGAAVFVDVRSQENFEISHVPGAINIPLSEFENNIANVDLDKDAWIITYCT